MLKYVVNYQSDFGNLETFGPFDTATKALDWMNSDVNYNLANAKENGVDLVSETLNDGYMVRIEDYGT